MSVPAVGFAWAGLIPIMILNGVARARLYGPRMTELQAHQLSTLIGVALLLAYTVVVFPWLHLDNRNEAFFAGAIWLVLTVLFEFGFGRYVAGHSWRRLLADYNVRAGRLWLPFLCAVAAAPTIALWLKS